MKKSLRGLVLFTAILLSSCDNDSVPLVQDPDHPVDAKGNPISTDAFLKKYCVEKNGLPKMHETCNKVRIAYAQGLTRGKMPEGW